MTNRRIIIPLSADTVLWNSGTDFAARLTTPTPRCHHLVENVNGSADEKQFPFDVG